MNSYVGASDRLAGLAWGSEDLSAALGASVTRDVSGVMTSPYRLARDLCLITASAAGVMAIDQVYVDFRDEQGLATEAAAAARDGFSGKMAIHPAQVPVINAAFTPSPDEIARAADIVRLFAANPGMGVISHQGQMLDRPHLRRAERILSRARGGGFGD
jgi:citrate lyase subunit beta/citryl-CoA lyase